MTGTTPLTVSLDPARDAPHRRPPRRARVPGGPRRRRRRARRGARHPRAGRARRDASRSAAPYPVDVVWRGKVLAAARPRPRCRVPAGRQVLTLVAPAVLPAPERDGRRAPAERWPRWRRPRWARSTSAPTPTTARCSSTATFVDYPPILDRADGGGRAHRRLQVAGRRRASEEPVEVDARRARLRDGPQGLSVAPGAPAAARSCSLPAAPAAGAELARRAGARPARGRPRLPQGGQGQAGARQLPDHRHRLPEHRLRGRRPARDRPLPPRGGRRRRQGARGLRAGRQALPAERRRARRLLLPRAG